MQLYILLTMIVSKFLKELLRIRNKELLSYQLFTLVIRNQQLDKDIIKGRIIKERYAKKKRKSVKIK